MISPIKYTMKFTEFADDEDHCLLTFSTCATIIVCYALSF